jgi:hypothetical protein
MMNEFRKVYVPGGMGLSHSAWWLVRVHYDAHGTHYQYLCRLARSDYR